MSDPEKDVLHFPRRGKETYDGIKELQRTARQLRPEIPADGPKMSDSPLFRDIIRRGLMPAQNLPTEQPIIDDEL